jgi:hypothetical protein
MEKAGISLSKEIKEQMQQATSYSQLAQLRNSEIQKHLKQNINQIQTIKGTELTPPAPSANKERVILISLLIISLISIGGLLVKLKAKKRSF